MSDTSVKMPRAARHKSVSNGVEHADIPLQLEQEREPQTRPAMAALRGTETVLLVAEEPVLRQALARAMRQLGYCVLCAANPSDAQFQAEAVSRIDLLLLDQVFPDPRNEQLAIWFRATYPVTKVLMASGTLWELNLNLGLSSEITFLAKPFTFLHLAQILRQVLA